MYAVTATLGKQCDDRLALLSDLAAFVDNQNRSTQCSRCDHGIDRQGSEPPQVNDAQVDAMVGPERLDGLFGEEHTVAAGDNRKVGAVVARPNGAGTHREL